jgi:uncharacterized protein YjbI with pentapeptide repeats
VIRALAIAIIVALAGLPANAAPGTRAVDRLRHCTGCSFPGADFRGAVLRRLTIANADLRGADFRGADLRGTHFAGGKLDGANFGGADLRAVEFHAVSLRGTTFAGAHFGKTQITSAWLDQRTLAEPARDDVLHFCFGCHLTNLDMHGSRLSGADFIGSDLNGVNLAGSDLRGALLGGAGFDHANLRGARLNEASLVFAFMRRADFKNARIGNAAVCATMNTSFVLNGVPFRNQIQCADLTAANLRGTDFRHARYCIQQAYGDYRHCRIITRRELVGLAHADLTGARASN